MSTPTSRTLDRLRSEGWIPEVVEQKIHIPGPKPRMFKRDLFGCIDVIACHKKLGQTLGVQCTTGDNHAARRTKALAEPRLKTWLLCGNRFEVWSWRKVDGRWQVRQEAVSLEQTKDLSAAAPAKKKRTRNVKQVDLPLLAQGAA